MKQPASIAMPVHFGPLWAAVNQHSLVSMSDPAGRITYANDLFVNLCGYSREELLGQNHRICKSDSQPDDFWATFWKTISSGQTWRGVICNKAKNGDHYWVDAQIFPFFDNSGAVESYLSIRTDITAHKRALDDLALAQSLKAATRALDEQKFYLRATLDHLPTHFWLKDQAGCYLAANQSLADACGRASPDEVCGLTDFELWDTEKALIYRRVDDQAMTCQQAQMREERSDSQGIPRWLEIVVKPLVSTTGKVHGTIGFSHDISERKLAQTQLQEHADQLSAIFDLSPDGFVTFDAARWVTYANPAFSRLTGIPLSQICGLDEHAFSDLLGTRCLPTCYFHGFDSLRQHSTGKPAQAHDLIELSAPGRRVLKIALRESQAGAVSQVFYLHDVTHETEVERLKSEFLSTAAHELRTPMTSIYGYAEVLQTAELDDVSRRDYLDIIVKKSELMVNILNDLLDLARIEERRGMDFVFEIMHVQQLVVETTDAFSPPQGRSAPMINLTGRPLHLLADSSKLHQAIAHVLSNAYKYSRAGSEVNIEVLEWAAHTGLGSQVGIRITDQGIGMTTEQLSRVFERFYRADTSGKVLGTGLGMSLVHEIIELHHGKVELDSQLGAGTTVTLWLPMFLERRTTPRQPENLQAL